jgi:hypothetical protein
MIVLASILPVDLQYVNRDLRNNASQEQVSNYHTSQKSWRKAFPQHGEKHPGRHFHVTTSFAFSQVCQALDTSIDVLDVEARLQLALGLLSGNEHRAKSFAMTALRSACLLLQVSASNASDGSQPGHPVLPAHVMSGIDRAVSISSCRDRNQCGDPQQFVFGPQNTARHIFGSGSRMSLPDSPSSNAATWHTLHT